MTQWLSVSFLYLFCGTRMILHWSNAKVEGSNPSGYVTLEMPSNGSSFSDILTRCI